MRGSGGKDADKNAWDIDYLNKYYAGAGGKVDMTRMLRDRGKGEGAFDSSKWGDYWNADNGVSRVLQTTNDNIALAAQRSNLVNETSPELQSRKDLGAIMNKLITVLGDSGSIGNGLKELITTLQSKF
jgi:hypothetical protein